MNTQQRYSSATLRRVQQFLDSHADVVGPINQSAVRQELDAECDGERAGDANARGSG
jgi:hypothetical protein